MSSKIKVDTIENVAGSGNVSLGSGHNLVVPGTSSIAGHASIGVDAVSSTRALTVAGATDGSGSSALVVYNSSLASKFAVRDDGLTTITNNATVGGTLAVTGETTLATHLNMGDNDRIKLGTGADLQIYHNGNNSYIDDTGTGNLYIRASDSVRLQSSTGEQGVLVTSNGAVTLYYDNSSKLATTSTGIDVTGSITADSEIDVASSSSLSTISATATGSANLVMGTNFSGSLSQGMVNQSGFLNMRQNYPLIFGTSEVERIRIFGAGNTTFSTTNQSPAEGTQTGARIGTTGKVQLSSTGDTTLVVNRVQDGRVMAFHSAGTLEGEIGISGTTTVYGAFTGTHWSRLTDNSQPTILKGTVLENIDEMCDWYQVQFEVDGSTQKASYALKDGEKVGDTITYTYKQDGVDDADYQAKIVKEDDDKHTKCKISDTADSKSVYGVFCAWDTDDDNVNDMKVASLGTHVIRVNKDETVSSGDLLSSNGDGTAKVQDDDIIRSKTIGKVLTNIKQETYDDGSYTVPCALYCG